ncbi:cyclic nucleotide-gated cation channel beta-1 [Drosophila navojoa]|uniref:cyclic nucleotide-gated cation channel beta-1 n=1 Tax=Drosophila navojoa TaxID=7232 RepID=UPI000846E9A8|nr:cyclic nucleotide-gated cation channel beta-1 [Drosophila navojoa]
MRDVVKLFRITSTASARVKRQVLWLPVHLLLAVAIICSLGGCCSAVGYSYARFEGPVAGPERLVTVHDDYGGGTHSDYVARPEYSFAYGIEDGEARVLQNRKETRNGDEVRGVYSVVDPDGTLRVVKYTADDANGFQAEVITNGVARLHGHGSEAGGPAHVEQQVEHEQGNELDDEADEAGAEEHEEEEGEEEVPQRQRKKPAKGQYKVHEHQGDDGDEGGEEEEEEGDNEGGGDHEEYEGSSEEGYEDAHTHSKQQEEDDSEEY